MDDVADVRKMYVDGLRTNKSGPQPQWTKEELLAGLRYYYELHGAFPTAHQIDAFEFLPSSRSIQRTYGGLVRLRNELLPAEIANFTKGDHRSKVAKETYEQARNHEQRFYEYLISEFHEIAVHEHKVIRPGDVNCDFFVYLTKDAGVVIDIFYAASAINLINIVNIKLKRYTLITPETYLILVGNDPITQDQIDQKTQNRQIPLPDHIHVVSEGFFRDVLVPQLRQRSAYAKL